MFSVFTCKTTYKTKANAFSATAFTKKCFQNIIARERRSSHAKQAQNKTFANVFENIFFYIYIIIATTQVACAIVHAKKYVSYCLATLLNPEEKVTLQRKCTLQLV